jgi:hypothetical protein
MKPGKSPTLGEIIQTAVPTPSSGVLPLQLKNRSNAHYGELHHEKDQQPLEFTLRCHGSEVLKVIFQEDQQHGRSTSKMFLVAADAQASFMAVAARRTDSDFFSGVEHLEVHVNAGVDSVLALLCVIGLILFQLPHCAGSSWLHDGIAAKQIDC